MVQPSDMPEPMEPSSSISDMAVVHSAMATHQGAMASFFMAAQAGKWIEAADFHLVAATALDAALDAFMRAARKGIING